MRIPALQCEKNPTQDAYIFCFYWTLGVMRTMPAEVTPVNLAERSSVFFESAFKDLQIEHDTTCTTRSLGIDFDESHAWDVLLIVPFKFFGCLRYICALLHVFRPVTQLNCLTWCNLGLALASASETFIAGIAILSPEQFQNLSGKAMESSGLHSQCQWPLWHRLTSRSASEIVASKMRCSHCGCNTAQTARQSDAIYGHISSVCPANVLCPIFICNSNRHAIDCTWDSKLRHMHKLKLDDSSQRKIKDGRASQTRHIKRSGVHPMQSTRRVKA